MSFPIIPWWAGDQLLGFFQGGGCCQPINVYFCSLSVMRWEQTLWWPFKELQCLSPLMVAESVSVFCSRPCLRYCPVQLTPFSNQAQEQLRSGCEHLRVRVLLSLLSELCACDCLLLSGAESVFDHLTFLTYYSFD